MTLKLLSSFMAYCLSGLALTYIFALLYVWITPGNELETIKNKGGLGPSITLSSTLFAFALPLLSTMFHGASLAEFIIWAIVSGILQLLVFWIFYKYIIGEAVWHSMLEDNNFPACFLYSALVVITGTINAISLMP